MNPEILKPILPTTARKPASIQEHKSYFSSLWDDSDGKSLTCRILDRWHFWASHDRSITIWQVKLGYFRERKHHFIAELRKG
jgi:hypothetical protein